MATATTQKTVLHVGCGPRDAVPLDPAFVGDDWREVRLDIDPTCDPDIVASITDMSVIQSESVDGVFSSHNLEHLYGHEVVVALKEFHRVLRLGGLAIIATPNLQAIAKAVAKGNLEGQLYQSPAGPITALDMIYGYRRAIAMGNHFWAHKTGFTAQTMAQKIQQAGFTGGDVVPNGLHLRAEATK